MILNAKYKKYELKHNSSSHLGKMIYDVFKAYTFKIITEDDLNLILNYYISNYSNILFENDTIKQTIRNIIGLHRCDYVMSLVKNTSLK